MNNTPRGSLHFTNLDIVRFAAAFYVLTNHTYDYLRDIYHLPAYLLKSAGGDSNRFTLFFAPVHQFLKNGGFGVDLFFLISGFLITSLLLKEKLDHGHIDVKRFYIRRILRIWPLYFLIIAGAFAFATYYTAEPFLVKDIYPHLFFVSNFTQISAGAWCSGKLFVLWSICIEEQFYLVIPLLLIFVPSKRLPLVLGGLILLSIIIRALLFWQYEYPWFAIYLHTGSRFDTLAVGCLLGYLNYTGFRFQPTQRIRAFIAAWLLLFLCFTDVFYYDSFIRAVIFKYVYVLPLSFLFLDLVQNILPGLRHPFWRWMNTLGKYSYGIYMYQVFVIVVADHLSGDYFSKSRWVFIILSLGLTLLISFLSYEIFEKHFLTLKKRFERVNT